MLFNTYSFILVFLPAALAGYFVLRAFAGRPAVLVWLTIVSLVFYAMWEPRNLLVLLTSVAVNFRLGTALAERAVRGRPTRLLLAVAVAFNLGLIGYFKYAGFFTVNLNAALGVDLPVLHPVLPLAISFFTFQQIAYLVDSARGETHGYTFTQYALMVTFFPQLIAGPIVIHSTVIPQFASPRGMAVSEGLFALGLGLFVFGLAKKVLFADTMAPQADLVFDQAARGVALSFAEAWAGALAYTLQLYFDFSGYSDMAIGLGLMFGVRLPLNFNSPYKATSIVDFWRRWHITLSAFLRNYLYVALGGNRRGEPRRYVNIVVTMLLGGLWHGAGWTFVIWGALHGVFVLIETVVARFSPASGASSGLRRAGGVALTFTLICGAFVFFRANSLTDVAYIYAHIFDFGRGFDGVSAPFAGAFFAVEIEFALAWALIALLLIMDWFDQRAPVTDQIGRLPTPIRWATYYAAATLIAFTFVTQQVSQQFVYFQF